MNSRRQLAELLQAAHREARASAPGAGELAIASTLDVNLAAVTAVLPMPWRGRGHGVVFPADGNPAGARLRIDFQGGGNFTTVAPGSRILAPFDRFDVYRAADSDTVGTARLYVLRRPDAELELGVAQPSTRADVTVCGPNGAAGQTQDSLAGNKPSAATDGVSLVGVEALRVGVMADDGIRTLGLPGLIRWWLYVNEPVTGSRWIWTEDYLAPTVPADVEVRWLSGDVLSRLRGAAPVAGPSGTSSVGTRVYPEVVSWPVTGGATNLSVFLYRSGRL